VGSILANSDAQNVPSFRRLRFEMKLSTLQFTLYRYKSHSRLQYAVRTHQIFWWADPVQRPTDSGYIGGAQGWMDSEEQPGECVPSCTLDCCHAALTNSPRAHRSSCCTCNSGENDAVEAGRSARLLWGAICDACGA
jgi:hypothetical protein